MTLVAPESLELDNHGPHWIVAKEIAEQYGLDQVVIVSRKTGEDGYEHVSTYGRKEEGHFIIAAKAGEFLKREILKWEDETEPAMSEHVRRALASEDMLAQLKTSTEWLQIERDTVYEQATDRDGRYGDPGDEEYVREFDGLLAANRAAIAKAEGS